MKYLVGWAFQFVGAIAFAQTSIPTFTPNVVDPFHYLKPEEVQAVNQSIQQMRDQADIHAAVFILESLQNETVEELAVRAFAEWKLGEAKKDNGLLLVLAMKDRQMRIETGYGLEGDIPDSIAHAALDEYLRPYLRSNQIQLGIQNAFQYLTVYKADPKSVPAPAAPSGDAGSLQFNKELDVQSGLYVWAVYIFLILLSGFRSRSSSPRARWIIRIFLMINPGIFIFVGSALLMANRAMVAAYLTPESLQRFFYGNIFVFQMLGAFAFAIFIVPPILGYFIRQQVETLQNSMAEKISFTAGGLFNHFQAKSFLLIFVSIFVTVFGVADPDSLFIFGIVLAAVYCFQFVQFFFSMKKYASVEAYKDSLRREKERKLRTEETLIRRGHATRNSDGSLTYTPLYYSSQRSSSSSRSSRSSSSSGGGRSGGGGASSSW